MRDHGFEFPSLRQIFLYSVAFTVFWKSILSIRLLAERKRPDLWAFFPTELFVRFFCRSKNHVEPPFLKSKLFQGRNLRTTAKVAFLVVACSE